MKNFIREYFPYLFIYLYSDQISSIVVGYYSQINRTRRIHKNYIEYRLIIYPTNFIESSVESYGKSCYSSVHNPLFVNILAMRSYDKRKSLRIIKINLRTFSWGGFPRKNSALFSKILLIWGDYVVPSFVQSRYVCSTKKETIY